MNEAEYYTHIDNKVSQLVGYLADSPKSLRHQLSYIQGVMDGYTMAKNWSFDNSLRQAVWKRIQNTIGLLPQ